MDIDRIHLIVPQHIRKGITHTRKGITYMKSLGFDSETIHGAPMTLQFFGDRVADVIAVNDATAEKKFFAALDKFVTTHELTVLFCHNLAFDMLSIFPQRLKELANGYFAFSSSGWDCEGVYGRPTFGKFSKGKKRALIVDTGRFCRAGTRLEQIAEQYCPDLPKLSMPEGLGEKQFSLSDNEFRTYAIRDAEIAYRFGQIIIQWHELYKVPMSLSGPHMAAQVFRKHYVTDTIILPSREVCWSALRAYHGGIQRAPHGPGLYADARCIDIVSAYPHAMADCPSFTNPRLYKRYTQRGCGMVPPFGVYRVSGTIRDREAYPALFDNSFNAVEGEFQINSTGFELNEFTRQRQGLLSKVDGWYYDAEKDKRERPMQKFVHEFFRMKTTATEKIARESAKLMLNSLYGKFIQTRVEEEPYYDVAADTFHVDTSLRAGGLFNPFLAACITAHTRARLCQLESKYSAVHSATDGIISNVRKSLPNGDGELGSVSLEAEGDALVLRPKLYVIYSRQRTADGKELQPSKYLHQRFIRKYALHGFRGSLESLETMLKEGKTEYEYTHVVGLKESLRTSLGRANDFIKRRGTLDWVHTK
jgi:hypothetical protein